MPISGVYRIACITTGKFYVGRSLDIEKRLERHRRELVKGIHHSVYLQRAWDKYGKGDFKFEVIAECSVSEAQTLEQHYLDSFPQHLYNVSFSAAGGDIISKHPLRELIVQKMSKLLVRRYSLMTPEERKLKYGRPGIQNPMFGVSHSEEAKSRISNANKSNKYRLGTKATDETKWKLSAIASQRIGDKNPFYGKHHSEVTRAKIALSKRGFLPANAKSVVIDGVEFPSLTEAARTLGVVTATILYRIKSPNPKYKGYFYKNRINA